MAHTVVALFNTESDARNAVEQLRDRGFSTDNIDVSRRSSSDSVLDTETQSSSYDNTRNARQEGGGIARFFRNLFGDDNDDNADRYSRVAERSGAVVTVHGLSDDEAERAADILDDYGALDVDEHDSSYSTTNRGVDTSTTTGGNMNAGGITNSAVTGSTSENILSTPGSLSDEDITSSDRTSDVNRTIPVIEEELQVGKRTVETGRVRLRSRVVNREVEENLRLREEYVTVDRNPVNRAATSADIENFKEGDVEFVERAEVPVVSKEARVVEEVRVGKEVGDRNETIRDTVRSTQVDVDEDRSRSEGLGSADPDRDRDRDSRGSGTGFGGNL